MNNVHLVLQGKGGIGKTFVSYVLAQYHLENSLPVCCVDTDPVNGTLSSFKALNVQAMELCPDNNIDEAQFDSLIEQIHKDDKNFVIDNGAASFIPMSNYIIQNEIVDLLSQAKRQVVVHIVISGGLGLTNTVSDFTHLAKQLPESAKIVVWLNEYFGKLEANGKSFEEMKAFKANEDRLTGIIRLARRPGSLFSQDVGEMLEQRLTFGEALKSKGFRLMSKQRLTMVRRDIFEQLDAVLQVKKIKKEAVAV